MVLLVNWVIVAVVFATVIGIVYASFKD